MTVLVFFVCHKYANICLLLVLVYAFVTLGDDCRHTNECFTKTHYTPCSVCKDEQCIFPFSTVYETQSPEKCLYRGDFCDHSPCKNGRCLSVFARALCYCDDTHYGSTCQHYHSDSKSLFVRDVHIFIPLVFDIGDYMQLFITSEGSGRNTLVIVSFGEGGYCVGKLTQIVGGRCLEPLAHSSVIVDIFAPCDYYYNADIRFPYIPFHKDRTMSHGVYQGYYSTYTLSMVSKEGDDITVTLDEPPFRFFVKTPSLDDVKCAASVEIRNCGPTWEEPVTYSRGKTIRVESDVHFYLDGNRPDSRKASDQSCKSDSKFIWRIWKFERYAIHNSIEGWQEEVYENTVISFPPNKFEFAIYKIELEVKYVPSRKPPISFAWCYFEAAHIPLDFRLDQSLKQSVLIMNGIHLSATKSNDPNEPDTREGQRDVNIEWTCLTMNKTLKCDIESKRLKPWEKYDVEHDELHAFTEYGFRARMWTDHYRYAEEKIKKLMSDKFLDISVTITVPSGYEELSIDCIKNCGMQVFTNEQLILKIHADTRKLTQNDTFIWRSCIEENSKPEQIPESQIVTGLPSMYLILKENSLKRGSSYYIDAQHNGDLHVNRYYFDTVEDVVYNGTCSVEPPTGQKGITEFDIICPMELGFTYQFEFYDKYKSEIEEGVIYSGRMLGTSFSGELTRVVLTRGSVMVYIINKFGLSVSQKIDVELSDVNVTVEYLSLVKQNISSLLEVGDVQRILRYVSVVPDVFEPVIAREEMVIKSLEATYQLSISNMADGKLATSTVKNVLIGMNKEKTCYLSTDTIKHTMKRIRTTTEVFASELSDFGSFELGQHEKYIDSMTIQHVAIYILDSLYSLILYANNDTFEVNEDFIDFDVSIQLKLSTKYAETIIDRVKNILTYLYFPIKPAEISSMDKAYTVWVVKNDTYFSVSEYLDINKHIPILVSDALMKDLLKQSNPSEETVALQVADCKQNIAWWSRGYVKSNLISLTFVLYKTSGSVKKRKDLDEPVDLLFHLQHIQQVNLTSTTRQLKPTTDPLSLDLNINVHRLDLPRGTLTEILFLFPLTKYPVRVIVLENLRPDYKILTERATIVNETSPLVTIKTSNYDIDVIHYMGVLPGPEVPVSESLEYTFEINTTHCQQLWTLGRWSGEGCDFKNNPDEDLVLCSCTHLSLFSVGVPIPSPYIEPYPKFKMLLAVYNNYLVIEVTLLLLLLYLITFIWAARQDSNDKYLRIVSILEDNFPSDRHPYLVAVWTSSRLDAGTTSHVAIKLYGEESQSRIHILSSDLYTVLRRNTENWFVILCPRALGNLYLMQVWHDNYGSSPQWYCEKICVYDLQNNVEYIFPVGQWLALKLDEYPEVAVLPAYIEDLKNKKRTFIDNCKYEMQEGHLVTSILLRHARSYITRLERLTILMCCVMIALAWSVFFYINTSHYGFDAWNTDVVMNEVLLTFQILIINVIFILFITFAFRKSAKFTYDRFKSTLKLRSESTAALLLRKSVMPEKLKIMDIKRSISFDFNEIHGTSVIDRFVRSLYNIKRTQSKVPAHLPHCKVNVKVLKLWYVSAWSICIAIIVISVIFIAIWSVSLGFNISQKCLFCAFLGVAEEIFVFTPLVIIIFSLLFSFGLNLCLEPTAYNVKMADLKPYRKLYDNEDHYYKIIEMRSSHCYSPINVLEREKCLLKIVIRYRWSLVVDFLVAVLFVISLNCITSSMWTSDYHSNYHTAQIFNLGHSKVGTIDFTAINTTSHMEQYLLGTFIRAAYLLRWYNGQLVFKKEEDIESSVSLYYRLSDCTQKMIGKPLVRQLRVKPIACNRMMCPNNTKCIPPYSLDAEDDSDYGTGWTPAKWNEFKKQYSPWRYNEGPSNWLFKMLTSFGGMNNELNYGGYMAHLSPSRFETILIVTELVEKSWLDPLTRAVVTEVTVYDVNKNLFSHISLSVEYSATIQWFHNIQVTTVPGYMSYNWGDLLFIVIVVFFIFVTIKSINKEGLIHYVSAQENILQILIIVFSVIVVVLFILHFNYTHYYLSNFESIARMEHFNFDDFVYYFLIAKICISILLAIAILQVLCLLKIGNLNTCSYKAFLQTLKYTVTLTTIYSLFIFVQWRLLAFILNMNIYHDVFLAFMEGFNTVHHIQVRCSQLGIKISLFATLICTKITMFIFVMLFLHFLRKAKRKGSSTFNFLTFILSEIRKWTLRRRK